MYEEGIHREPVSILFDPSGIQKKDVWEIDLIKILDILIEILQKSGQRDLRIAGQAALTSSHIYRLKVESIFALQKIAAERPPLKRTDVDIDMIGIPYRHESTYPVTLDELLGILENLIRTIANPQKRRGRAALEPVEPPDFEQHLISFESIVGKYRDLILQKIRGTGSGLLGEIVSGLDPIDSIRCFFAVLFMAKDEGIRVEQEGEEIRITLLGSP